MAVTVQWTVPLIVYAAWRFWRQEGRIPTHDDWPTRTDEHPSWRQVRAMMPYPIAKSLEIAVEEFEAQLKKERRI